MKKKQNREKAAPIHEKGLISVKGSSGYVIVGGGEDPPPPTDGQT